MDPDASAPSDPPPSVFNYVLSFLLVGVAWGFTTPFIRRAAADFNARQEKQASGSIPPDQGRARETEAQTSSGIGIGGGEEEQELLSLEEEEGETVDRGEQEGNRRDRSSDKDTKAPGKSRGLGKDRGNAEDSADDENEEDNPPSPAWRRQPSSNSSWLRSKIVALFLTVVNLLRTPAYSIPLVINLTGSVWFFLLVGKHELSLTVPLANSSAFLFTVLGEWYVERKVIAKETWLGMGLVLGGIALCVHSKN